MVTGNVSMLTLRPAERKNRPTSCRRPCALNMPTAKRFHLSAALVIFFWMVTPETVDSTITKGTCEQTHGRLDSRATLRCVYEPSTAALDIIYWKKGQGTVYIYESDSPSNSKAVNEFDKRNVTTTNVGVDGASRVYDLHIYTSRLGDEDIYKCDILPKIGFLKPVQCPRLALRVPPSMFNLSYVDGGSSISIPERNTDCTTGGITIKINGTTTLRYVTASRPKSTITWNQVTDGSRAHTPLSDNTTQTTFQGDVTVKQGDTKLVKFNITSQNPNFTAGPLVKEACITLHHAGESSPPVHRTGELVAIILGSLAAVALISGGVALAMWKMRLACWKNTALTH